MLTRIGMTVGRHTLMMLPVGLLLLSFGCATADFPMATTQWVGDRLKPLEERLAKLEMTSAAEKGRLDQLTGRVVEMGTHLNQVEATANEAKAIGTEARTIGNRAVEAAAVADRKAEQGIAKANQVDGRVTQSLANRYKRTQVQEFSVGFKSGDSTLSEEAQQSLQNAAKLLKDNPTYSADSIGHTDDVGNARYNINLSWRRQEAIRRFLMQNGCELNRIFFIGVGEEQASGKDSPGRAQDRRGTIVVYRPAE